ncbi:ImmA/IrrE family metallo-endopeptidase [Leucobacter viscericola]|uniref:ImmA/IrrE family metallo-endopeptidase n=1 Tax=Leucobacter viscericola TaxID=2714935 RepID=A0A6G7XHR6_9MICO|nr:ImmA/IrrE family metallo-endopeptidase [Leucobacter viscericola]QIK64105.1 ImmA/IrrE family metallo-endopeptidase [Leucobacter viscericola]
MQLLFDYAEALGLTVEFAPLRDRNGEYRHDLKRIRLREGMPERLARWTLAHELGHAVFGDELSMFGPANAKMERRADEWAALLLIDVDIYREVEMLRDGHAPSMASDLNVAERCVIVFQGLMERIGDAVYLEPKMGVGQWSRRIEVA